MLFKHQDISFILSREVLIEAEADSINISMTAIIGRFQESVLDVYKMASEMNQAISYFYLNIIRSLLRNLNGIIKKCFINTRFTLNSVLLFSSPNFIYEIADIFLPILNHFWVKFSIVNLHHSHLLSIIFLYRAFTFPKQNHKVMEHYRYCGSGNSIKQNYQK